MKSAYDRAMERFGDEPVVSLSDEQKAALAEIENRFKAKIAEKELFLGDLLKQAAQVGNYGEVAQIKEQQRREIGKLERDREEEKEKIRNAG